MGRRILLSGSSGLIGSSTFRYFQDNIDWEIITTFTDLTKPLPDMGHFDVIVHLASLSSVEQSIAEPVSFIQNNVAISLNMLEYARKYPPEMFINFSTTGIYTSQSSPKAMLDDIKNRWGAILPTNPYIASKLSQEAIAYSYYRTYKVPVIIVSSSNVVGSGQQSANFVPKIIDAVLSGREIPIYTNSGEIGSRVYNPVTNVADALMFIIENVAPNMDADRPDTFSLSGGQRLDNLEMAQMISNILNKPLNYKLVEGSSVRLGYDMNYDYADDGLERLGWQPVQTLRQGLEDMLKSLK